MVTRKKKPEKSAGPKELRHPTPSETDDSILPLDFSKTPAFAYASLFVAAINTKDQLVYTNQTKSNGPFNKSWKTINANSYVNCAANATLDGRIAIVASEATSNNVHYIAEDPASTSAADRWLAAENLGLPKGVSSFEVLTITRGINGLDNVFASTGTNSNTSLWWKYQNPPVVVTKKVKVTPPGSTTPITVTVQETQPPKKPWSDWVNVNGVLEGNLKGLKASNNADGRIVLTGIYFNGLPWVSQQLAADPFDPAKWSEWVTTGNNSAESAGAMNTVLDTEGFVSIFVSTNNGILRSRQTEPGGISWGTYSSPGQIADNVADHAVQISANGHIYVATLNYPPPNTSTIIYGTLQTNVADSQWTSWQRIGATFSANEIELAYDADGTLVMFVLDTGSGELSCKSQVTPNSTEWYFPWTQLGSGIKSMAIARDLTPPPGGF